MKVWKIILGLFIVIIIIGNLFINYRAKINDYKNIIELNNNKLDYYKNRNNILTAKKKVLNITIDELKSEKNHLIENQQTLKDEIKRYKNLNSYLQGKLLIKGKDTVYVSDTSYIVKKDTIYEKKISYNNKYLSFDGIIQKNKLSFNYNYNTDFTYITYWKKEKLFSKKDLVMNFTLNDPNAKLTSAQSITIKPPKEKFYQKKWFWGATGLLTGILISK